jgi:hypothetical protein
MCQPGEMTSRDLDRLVEVARAHARAEARGDLEGTLVLGFFFGALLPNCE